MTYQPKVYRKQGADEMVVASGGKLNLESGSTVTLAGNADMSGTFAMTGTLTISSGGGIVHPLTTKSSTNKATAIVANTINVITCSSTASACSLPAPSAGKFIYAICKSRVSPGTYTLGSSVDFVGLATNKLKFDAAAEQALLISATTAWCLVSATATATS